MSVRTKRLQWREFVAEYQGAIDEGTLLDKSAKRQSTVGAGRNITLNDLLKRLEETNTSLADPMPWGAINDSWFVVLLRKAAKANHGDALQVLLRLFLARVGLETPGGVFVPLPKPLGRPKKPSTNEIVKVFREIKPRSLTTQHLARAFYGDGFTNAKAAEKERMVDRCRRAVERSLPPDEINKIIRRGK